MKKLLMITLGILLLVGCSSSVDTPTDGKLKIVTTIFPITDLVERITGQEPTQLLPNSSVNAHTWEPSPQDIIALEEADVFVYNGAGMEEWVDDVLATIKNEKLVVIEASHDVTKIQGHHHDHDHDEDDHDDDEHDEDDHEHDHGEDDHGDVDPHTWSSPKTAKTQLQTINDALIKAFPEKAETYKQNTEKNLKLFDELDQKYMEKLSQLTNRYLVVQHEAYGYLAHDYDLHQIGIEGLVPTSEPDPSRMAEIIELVKEHEVKTIFFEENVSDKVATTLSEETGTKTAVLNTLAFKNEHNDDLIKMMETNLEVLLEGLK